MNFKLALPILIHSGLKINGSYYMCLKSVQNDRILGSGHFTHRIKWFQFLVPKHVMDSNKSVKSL